MDGVQNDIEFALEELRQLAVMVAKFTPEEQENLFGKMFPLEFFLITEQSTRRL
jgi:hypothetical protein